MADTNGNRRTQAPRVWNVPTIGVSSCLMGENVRFDTGHKRDRFVTDRLARFVECIPRCPEMAIGLGTPREPIHLVAAGTGIDAHGVRSGHAVGKRLRAYGEAQAKELHGLSGYLFKAKSPSCGLHRVPIYTADGQRTNRRGHGLYADRVIAAMPWLPVEDEGRLNDAGLRDNFLVRIFTLDRLQRALMNKPPVPRELVDFHTDHKYLVMAHNVAAYKRLGRLVARAGTQPLDELVPRYRDELMQALSRPARIPHHVNVLQHLMGYLRDQLDREDRAEIADTIEQFREGLLPWVAVRMLLRHHFRRHPDEWVNRQVYLEPYPDELAAP
ncbi:MAG TPA: DUF523 and DUF1722 domain-containing protein [Gammaproteobacteria bacterium]|nr:DUF523 and DUF1722 domain-containing protein [Gammaproteobacteria bacterium]